MIHFKRYQNRREGKETRERRRKKEKEEKERDYFRTEEKVFLEFGNREKIFWEKTDNSLGKKTFFSSLSFSLRLSLSLSLSLRETLERDREGEREEELNEWEIYGSNINKDRRRL